MFRGLINDAKSAAGSVVAKQAARASVVVPFLIALGFLIAGLSITLTEWYGQRNAYVLLGAGFSVVGLLTAVVVRSKEHDVIAADAIAERVSTEKAHTATDTVAAVAIAELPLALLGAFMSSTSGPASAAGAVRLVGRNLPLVFFVAALGFLVWPRSAAQAPVEDIDGHAKGRNTPQPNGVDRSGEFNTTA